MLDFTEKYSQKIICGWFYWTSVCKNNLLVKTITFSRRFFSRNFLFQQINVWKTWSNLIKIPWKNFAKRTKGAMVLKSHPMTCNHLNTSIENNFSLNCLTFKGFQHCFPKITNWRRKKCIRGYRNTSSIPLSYKWGNRLKIVFLTPPRHTYCTNYILMS